jgi:hypothetical protein
MRRTLKFRSVNPQSPRLLPVNPSSPSPSLRQKSPNSKKFKPQLEVRMKMTRQKARARTLEKKVKTNRLTTRSPPRRLLQPSTNKPLARNQARRELSTVTMTMSLI